MLIKKLALVVTPIILIILLSSTIASTGSDWLAEQSKNNGAIQSTTPRSASFLSTAESLKTFSMLGETSRALIISGRNYLNAHQTNENAIISQLLSTQALTGLYETQLVDNLLNNVNTDGGFGALKGSKSDVFNTVMVLETLYYTGSDNQIIIENALNYLKTQQKITGAFSFNGDNEQNLALTAITSTALQRYQAYFSSTQHIYNANQFILTQRNNNISWNSHWETALALIALASSEPNRQLYQSAITDLQSAQLTNGSWNNDSYTTALALRAQAILDGNSLGILQGDAEISGKVIDSKTNLPLKNARLEISETPPRSVLTNENGQFKLSKIEAGEYNLSVQKAGFQARSYHFEIQAQQISDMGTLPLLRQPDQGILFGTATDSSTGEALSNVAITINTVPETIVYTTLNGSYETSLMAGEIEISAEKSGYHIANASGLVIAGQSLNFSPALLDIGTTQPTTANIKGLVVNASNNNPLDNVIIKIIDGATTQTTNTGTFEFLGLIPATLQITIEKIGFQTITVSLISQLGDNDLGIIRLPLYETPTSFTFNGTVTDDETSQIIANATIALPELGLSVLSDAEGKYQFSGVDQLNLTFNLSANGYQSRTFIVNAKNFGEKTLNFEMRSLSAKGDLSITTIHPQNESYNALQEAFIVSVV